MIVIAIIGILASVVLVNLNGARTKARDAKRKISIDGIAKALMVYSSSDGFFPASSFGGACGTALDGSDVVSTALIAGGFYSTVPIVPSDSGGNCGNSYYTGSWSSGKKIAVLTQLENIDGDCKSWVSGVSWYNTGSYCNRFYIKALPDDVN